MSRTITALFDTQADADAGAERVRKAGIDAGNVSIHDKASHTTSGDYSTRTDQGLWAKIKNSVLPDQDRHTYEEGVKRGGFLLTIDAEDDETAKVVSALEEANTIDLDERSQQWRSDGWDYQPNSVSSDEEDGAFNFAERDTDYSTGRYRSYSRATDGE